MTKRRTQWWQRPPADPDAVVPAPKPPPKASGEQSISTRARRSASQRKVKTAAQADDIKRRYLAGATLREIAGELGIDHETVRKMLIRLGVSRRGRWG